MRRASELPVGSLTVGKSRIYLERTLQAYAGNRWLSGEEDFIWLFCVGGSFSVCADIAQGPWVWYTVPTGVSHVSTIVIVTPPASHMSREDSTPKVWPEIVFGLGPIDS